VSGDQLSLFEQSRRLEDLGLLERLAGAEQLLDQEPTCLAEREELLVLVCWPATWAAES